jgi:uncharacterized protein (DUF305 family)
MRTRIVGGLMAALTAAALAAGCSTDSSVPPASPGSGPSSAAAVSPEHNAADVAFVQGMLPHHSQAVAMSRQAESRASSPQVKDLARRISAAQGPEIEQMNGMLAAWGAPAAGGMSGMPGMNGMPGMMSDQQMSQLAAAAGPDFDRLFLAEMTAHHQGAITMARTELDQGQNPQAKQLAQAIIDAQQAEITEMEALIRQG